MEETQPEAGAAPEAQAARESRTPEGPTILDLAALLAPIPGDDPAGESLRYADTYDTVKEARRMDDPSLPQGVWEAELKKADWNLVVKVCEEALARKSKDLQLAAWLVEALLNMHGFAGLREGLTLIAGLCERYWETMHPRMEGEDLEMRLSPLHWMNAKMAVALKLAPVTAPRDMDARPYAFVDWETANALEHLAVRDKGAYAEAEREGKTTRAKFLGSVMFTSASHFARLAADLAECVRLTEALEAFLDKNCGRNSPSLVKFRETLKEIRRLAEKFHHEKDNGEAGAEPDASHAAYGEEESVDEQEGAPERRVGRIRSRSEAYRMLSEAADYLMTTEPHSPVPYLVKRAVSWGNMSLSELLAEIVNDQSDLHAIHSLLGLRLREEE
ncbi:MAG: type VI secretion system protein TssA [Thermodesulfobacteriota bacterium]